MFIFAILLYHVFFLFNYDFGWNFNSWNLRVTLFNMFCFKTNNIYPMGFSGLTNIKCHTKFKSCITKVQKSGMAGFSQQCPYSIAIPTMVNGMDIAIMFSQFSSGKFEL